MAEAVVWNALKASKLNGYKFVRQMPIGPYFADFACRSARLIVEIDGSQHADSRHDLHRDRFLQEAGYSVLRFWSHEAIKQTDSVCSTIIAALEGRLDPHIEAADLRFFPHALRRR